MGINYIDVWELTTGNVDFHASPEELKNLILSAISDNFDKEKEPQELKKPDPEARGLESLLLNDAMTRLIKARNALKENSNDQVTINTTLEREIEFQIAKNALNESKKLLTS